MKVNKSCLRRNVSCIIFLWVRLVFFLYVVDAFWLPCCIFVDVLLWYSNTYVAYYFDEVSCYVCVRLGIFSCSYYVLIMGFLARSVEYTVTELDSFCVCEPPEDGR
jgi:hypothetical protein